MEFEKSKSNPNPWERASFVSRLFFWWLTPLFFKGRKGDLKLSDMYDCPEVDSSEKIGDLLRKEWDKELDKLKSGKHPSLVKATIRAFGLRLCWFGLLLLIQECVVHIVQPVLLGYLIEHFARTNVLSKFHLYLCTTVFCILSAVGIFTIHPSFFGGNRIGMRVRIACCSLIYRKALKLSQASLGKTSVGQMTNLMTNDVSRFDQCVVFFLYVIIGPIQSVIIVWVLWKHVGYAGLVGISLLLLLIPVQPFIGKVFSKLRSKTAILTDKRIRLMNEIIGGMRVIKMYGWEISFAKLVDICRRKEVEKIRRTAFMNCINKAFTLISSKIILLIIFVIFLLGIQGDLTPEKVFVFMALFHSVEIHMTFSFPTGIALGAEALISLKRIQEFLLLEEHSESNLAVTPNVKPGLSHCGIWMNKVTASWNKDGEVTLHDVTLTVKPGEILAVVGPVGCGKSSLLMSILGELPITSGEVKVHGQMACASQEPWVFTGTVQQNIIFGRNFDEAKYKEVLDVCALEEDIQQFPYGDQTTVGEKGVILSGGQKARVNLARTIYFNADVYLLDDPLSAVDASVSKHLFEQCISGYLKDKVRILVTHQIQFLKNVSQILVLKDGKCLALGSYQDLINAGIDLGSLIDDNEDDRGQWITSANGKTPVVEDASDTASAASPHKSALPSSSTLDGDCKKGDELVNSKSIPKVIEEIKSSGAINLKIYKQYIISGAGPFLGFSIVVLCIITQALFTGSDFWVAAWTNLEQLKYNIRNCWVGTNKTFLSETGYYNDSHGIYDHDLFRQNVANVSEDCFILTQNYTKDEFDANKDVRMNYQMSVYGGLVSAIFLFSIMRTTLFYEICMRASVTLHDKMFRSVLRSPVAFFDRNPIGRVLNRFSKDTGIIDEILPSSAYEATKVFSRLLGAICVVVIIEPYLLLPTVALGISFEFLRRFYMPTLRDIKRYEAINRSPVLSHLSISLNGLTTIRTLKVQRPFEINFDHHQDQHTATWFLFLGTSGWLGVILDLLYLIYISTVTATMVVLAEDPSYASRAGLAIASLLQLSVKLQWFVKQSADIESQMTSVERVVEYSNLEPEAPLENEQDQKPPQNWPFKGCVLYRNVNLKYVPDEPLVLKDLNFDIYPEEKVGIVGRTGAGKSSVIATLFRMEEPEGQIIIDGICTKNVGLHDLRKKISIIPQDPILFTGSIRRNLDPFDAYSDNDLWQALDEAHLKTTIGKMPDGLFTKVSDGGSNFSVGQRQLICLTRAILRRNKILVLDEATANVDQNTDFLIQKTIRERFAHCTVLTIAHRLHTIMDSDRVLVLDAGEIKEFDEPYDLLQDSDGCFSQMVQMTGSAMAKQLREMAYAAHLKKSDKTRGETHAYREPIGNNCIEMNLSNSSPREVIGDTHDLCGTLQDCILTLAHQSEKSSTTVKTKL